MNLFWFSFLPILFCTLDELLVTHAAVATFSYGLHVPLSEQPLALFTVGMF